MSAARLEAEPQRGAPPLGNTGVDRTRGFSGDVGCTWLAGTVKLGREAAGQLLGSALGVEVEDLGYGFKWYEQAGKLGAHGSTLAWVPRSAASDRTDEVSFQVVQQDCEQLGAAGVRELAGRLLDAGARFTRVDFAYDDVARVVEPRVVLEAFRGGQVVSHVRKSSLRDDAQRGGAAATTVYLGSRTSEGMLRIYDKDAEQGVALGTHGVRWELEAHKAKAHDLVQTVLLSERELGQAFAAALVALVDFRERGPEQAHGERGDRLQWWAQLVGQVSAARAAAARVIDSLDRRRQWVERQVETTLGLLTVAAGGDVSWLLQAARRGVAKLGPQHWALVDPRLRPPLAVAP